MGVFLIRVTFWWKKISIYKLPFIVKHLRNDCTWHYKFKLLACTAVYPDVQPLCNVLYQRIQMG